VLIGGLPGSGKSTLAIALAAELELPLLAKDEIKEALMGAVGEPLTVSESQRLGRAAVLAMLRVARRCRGAVLDSTWFGYTEPLIRQLPGLVVEVRCHVPVALARERGTGSAWPTGTLDISTGNGPRMSSGENRPSRSG
jgi:predicted kinase